MNVGPSVSTAPPERAPQHVSDVYGGQATATPGDWPSVSSAPSPTQSPSPGAQIGHAKRFLPAAAAAIGAFLVVPALFWAAWLERRRAYPEFASVYSATAASARVGGENPFTHPRDEKEDDAFELERASSACYTASTLSV